MNCSISSSASLVRGVSSAATQDGPVSRPPSCTVRYLPTLHCAQPYRAARLAGANDTGIGVVRVERLGQLGEGASNDDRDLEVVLDQYYTQVNVAAHCYSIMLEYLAAQICDQPAGYRLSDLLLVEPSGGTGSFFRLMPVGSISYDKDPKYPGIETADFLEVQIPNDRPIVILGNPPFGRNASMAVRFFNQAASQAIVIGFILPASFKKASIQNRLDRRFHLVSEHQIAPNAFLFKDKPVSVPAVFQIWERRDQQRRLWSRETTHPDFEFTEPSLADFAIQRVGARAGRVHHNFKRSQSSHYFIKGDVEAVMRQLDFASVARNVAGNRSLAKSEIIRLYREWRAGTCR